MHVVSLQQAAGVESHFAEFVLRAAQLHPEWSHGWLNPARTMHPFIQERVEGALALRVDAKFNAGRKIPAWPRILRVRHCRAALRRAEADTLLLWNRTAKTRFAVDAIGAERCVHWEHGAAWDAGHERERRAYFERVPHALANSRAAARVLEDLWRYQGTIAVCLNALRPSLVPQAPMVKRYPRGRAVRLGVAARLFPVKGVPLVLHALRLLAAEGVLADLHIAGAGPDREALADLAAKLGIAEQVRFLGAVRDMAAFYDSVDALVHPPLTEAFGLVSIEAGARGCPVIAAAVDGLPEAVSHGISGVCVAPTLALSDYPALGGRLHGLPELVFDPAADRLTAPRLVDPGALAAALRELFADPANYELMSAHASKHVLRVFQFDRHVSAVMGALEAVRRAR